MHQVKRLFYTALLSPLIFSASVLPSKAAITFSGLSGANSAPLGIYTEGGFTLTPTSSTWYEAHVYGNPVPSIYDGPISSPLPGTLQISYSQGAFAFSGLAYSSNNGNTSYSIQGLRGNSVVYQISGMFTNLFGFSNFTAQSGISLVAIDKLSIQISPQAPTTSFNIDNIAVAAIPEPRSIPLTLVALALCLLSNHRTSRRPVG